MLSESEAIERILSAVIPLPPQLVPLHEALNRFAAQTLLAMVPLPGFNNSAMDGYALRAVDSNTTQPLRVTGEQPAGSLRNLKVGAGEAVRIFTGAPIPAGADAVIMQEDVSKNEGGDNITCNEPVTLNENIRLMGCDICVGQRIIEPGWRITPARVGILAAQGLSTFPVTDCPRVAVVTTGDELAAPGTLLKPGQIYNSNGVMLQTMLGGLGIRDVSVRHVSDDYLRTADALRELIGQHDFIIMCGGVSVGDHDCVRPALQAMRVRPDFWKVNIKPGKPLLFAQARREDDTRCIIFGLPGNPVSAFVTFMLFARPALLKAMGACKEEWMLPRARALLNTPMKNSGDRPHYVCGQFDGNSFIPQGNQRSHELLGLGNSNALLRMEPESRLDAGADVLVLLV